MTIAEENTIFTFTRLTLSFETIFFSVSRTEPYDELVRERPLVSLMSPGPILSIITQMIVVIAVQTFMYFNVQDQPW